MMRKLFKKRKRSGFTLAETLVAILILLMVSAIVAGAIPTAANVYTKTVDAANAQVLLSTVITVLRDELGTAVSVTVPGGGTAIDYVNGNDGYRRIKLKVAASSDDEDSEGEGSDELAPGIWLYNGQVDLDSGAITYVNPRLIVSGKAVTNNLIMTFGSVAKDADGVITFTDLAVNRTDGATLAKRDTFRIRTVKKPNSP